jgi:hypothetical protein
MHRAFMSVCHVCQFSAKIVNTAANLLNHAAPKAFIWQANWRNNLMACIPVGEFQLKMTASQQEAWYSRIVPDQDLLRFFDAERFIGFGVHGEENEFVFRASFT